jgi:hypothetical protein
MLKENAALPPRARRSVRAIYEHIRDEEGFRGGYSTVKDFVHSISNNENRVHPISHNDNLIWEHTYDLLMSLERKRAIELLVLLSSGKSSVISPVGTKRFLREAARIIRPAPKSDHRSQARHAKFEWMRAVLQNEIDADSLHREIGDVPDLKTLLHYVFNGRLSDRNRSMVVLASRRGLSGRVICDFLSIDLKSCSRYLRTFERGGVSALFKRQTKSNRKFDDKTLKKAVFSLLHEPLTTSIVRHGLCPICIGSCGKRDPACPEVIRTITKAAGYRWRKARIVLTSNDPAFSEKLDRIRSILSNLGSDEAFFSIDEFGPFAVKTKPGRMLTAPGKQRIVSQWQKSKAA